MNKVSIEYSQLIKSMSELLNPDEHINILSETAKNDDRLVTAALAANPHGSASAAGESYNMVIGVEDHHEKVIEFVQHYVVNDLPEEIPSNEGWGPPKLNNFEMRYIESLISTDEDGKVKLDLYWNVLRTSVIVGIPRLTRIMMEYTDTLEKFMQILPE